MWLAAAGSMYAEIPVFSCRIIIPWIKGKFKSTFVLFLGIAAIPGEDAGGEGINLLYACLRVPNYGPGLCVFLCALVSFALKTAFSKSVLISC